MFEVRIILLCLPSILLASTVNGKNFPTFLTTTFFFLTHFRTFHASNEYCAFQFYSESTQNFSRALCTIFFPSLRNVIFLRLFIYFSCSPLLYIPFANFSALVDSFFFCLTPIKNIVADFLFHRFVWFFCYLHHGNKTSELPNFRCVPS